MAEVSGHSVKEKVTNFKIDGPSCKLRRVEEKRA
jgi:hypothetical protein